MQPLLNRQLFEQRVFDAGSLGVLVSVIHQFTPPGRYEAAIMRGDSLAANFYFIIDERYDTRQLSIDLFTMEKQRKEEKAHPLVVSPNGYVLFYASRGTGYSVRVGMSDQKEPVFDSRKLGPRDLVAMSLLEPGKYSVFDRIGGAKGQITVSLSPSDAKRLKSLEPVYVDVRGKTLEPAEVQLVSTQGLVFRVHESSRIVVEKQGQAPKESKPVLQRRFRPAR